MISYLALFGLTAVLIVWLILVLKSTNLLMFSGFTTLITIYLWSTVFSVWQTDWNFTVLEPVLLTTLFASVLLGYWQFSSSVIRWIGINIALIGIGCCGVKWAISHQPLATTAAWDAHCSIAPTIAALACAIPVFQALLNIRPVIPPSVAFGVSLAIALILDAMLYLAYSGGIETLGHLAWLHPLSIKLLIAEAIASPIVGIYLHQKVEGESTTSHRRWFDLFWHASQLPG